MKTITMSLDEYNADLYNAKLSGLAGKSDISKRLKDATKKLSKVQNKDELHRVVIELLTICDELEK